MIEDEEKHKRTRSILKSLPKVKARSDFESKLLHRIRNIETERLSSPAFRKLEGAKVSKRWLGNILRPVFIPAAGLVVIVLIAFLLYMHNQSLNKDTSPQITQSITPGEKESKSLPFETQKESIAKTEESPITKEESMKRGMTERSISPKLPESDFSSSPEQPITAPGIIESETPPIEDQSKDRLSEPKEEKRAIEKKTDDSRRVDKKSGHENIQNEDETGQNGDILQKVVPPAVEGKMKINDTIKLDSLKMKSSKKKEGKILKDQKDSVNIQQQEEKQPDSTKNK